MARAATTTDAFNAVAEPRRRQILDVLAAGERPVNDLVRVLGLSQPQVSKHLLYKAWTTPELVRRWWNANRGEVTVAEIDLRVGGTWRYVMLTPDGLEVAFHGEYREIVPNERIVSTEVYEGAPGGDDDPAVNVVAFAEDGGRT